MRFTNDFQVSNYKKRRNFDTQIISFCTLLDEVNQALFDYENFARYLNKNELLTTNAKSRGQNRSRQTIFLM